ncbi:TrkA C-terminal domain-containing protein [Absicoccus porci]|uniref:TrkA C-terminal domain-containing protein n=1 Tax=Absicoccus porci TaxID=2486576 RepID=UPI001FE880F0|nr:TrkA C-terminal domain-containing protein [Absicoccus porci]
MSTFAKGRVEIVEIIVGEDSSLSNTKVRTIGSRHHGHVLICAVNRGKEVIIPDGEFVIQKGDRISVIGTTQHIESFLITTGISEYRNFNEIMIVGGGRITYYLASMMLGMNIRVKIIEKNPDKCRQLALQFPEANVILGDGCICCFNR